MNVELSERQRRAVAAAVTILSAVVILSAVAAIVFLLGAFARRFANVLLPLAVAGVLALVVRPYYELLREQLRLPAPAALVVVFLSLLLPFVAFAWFFGALAVDQLSDLVGRIPDLWRRVVSEAQERWPRIQRFVQQYQLEERLEQAVQGQGARLVQGLQFLSGKALSAGAGVLHFVGGVLGWAVFPVYFAFFLMADAKGVEDLERLLPFLKPETRRDVAYLVHEFVNIVVAFFRGQLLVALLQGILFALGFSLVGLRYGLILGLMLGFLNIIPYLGSIVGLGIALPLGYFQEGGGAVTVIAVLVVFTVVQMIEGYLLTPRIMGDRTGLHPMAIIVAVFFWGSALGGILGMILAIPLTAFLVVFWRLAREKYISELV